MFFVSADARPAGSGGRVIERSNLALIGAELWAAGKLRPAPPVLSPVVRQAVEGADRLCRTVVKAALRVLELTFPSHRVSVEPLLASQIINLEYILSEATAWKAAPLSLGMAKVYLIPAVFASTTA